MVPPKEKRRRKMNGEIEGGAISNRLLKGKKEIERGREKETAASTIVTAETRAESEDAKKETQRKADLTGKMKSTIGTMSMTVPSEGEKPPNRYGTWLR